MQNKLMNSNINQEDVEELDVFEPMLKKWRVRKEIKWKKTQWTSR